MCINASFSYHFDYGRAHHVFNARHVVTTMYFFFNIFFFKNVTFETKSYFDQIRFSRFGGWEEPWLKEPDPKEPWQRNLDPKEPWQKEPWSHGVHTICNVLRFVSSMYGKNQHVIGNHIIEVNFRGRISARHLTRQFFLFDVKSQKFFIEFFSGGGLTT